jgi:hypothetical protein
MMFSSVLKGLGAAWRQPKLVFLLWAWNLLLAAAVTLPMWAWLRDTLDLAVEGPALLGQFNAGAMADLVKYADPNPFDLLGAGARGAVLVALVASAFMNGGILEVLGTPDDRRSFMHRFFRGGGHFFWRFMRLMIIAAVPCILVVGAVVALITPALQPLADSEWGYGMYVAGLLTLAAVSVCGGFFILALDYARIRVAREDSRGMFVAYIRAMGFVMRHAFAAYGMAIVVLVVVGVVLLLYVGHETVWTTTGWGTLLLLIVLQQLVVLARMGLRVALVGAERDYYLAHQPVAAAPIAQPAPPAPEAPTHIDGTGEPGPGPRDPEAGPSA